MRQGFLVDHFALRPQIFHDVVDLNGVPVQDGIGNQAQATGFVHDLLVIASRKFTLVGKENPPRQLVPIFALVELELHRLPEFQVSEIAQNILGFDDLPELKPETLERGKRIVEQSGSGWNFDVLHDQFTQS